MRAINTSSKLGEGPDLTIRIVSGMDRLLPAEQDIATKARSFLEYQYPEIRDLAKHFLTVIAGVLTLSVAFSEKIVSFDPAPPSMRALMAGIWVFCFMALVLGGAAVFLIYNAGIGAKQAGKRRDREPRYLWRPPQRQSPQACCVW